ncbi:hypothetical protein [Tumebacillus lipolyticus]
MSLFIMSRIEVEGGVAGGTAFGIVSTWGAIAQMYPLGVRF